VSSAYEEEINSAANQDDEDDEDEDKDDFVCVPVNNIDNETVHIKVLDEDTRTGQLRNQGQVLDNAD
jgi:hypothetical protein